MNQALSKWTERDSTREIWFRGEASLRWKLLPGIYRSNPPRKSRPPRPSPNRPAGSATTPLSTWEREIHRDFTLRAPSLIDRVPSSYLEWLFVMQHHGLPTRLIDWTEGHLTALYFSLISHPKEDGGVWILDPWSLNELSIEQMSIPTVSHPRMWEYELFEPGGQIVRKPTGELPVAIRPARATVRITVQKGMFTIHGCDDRPLDKIVPEAKTPGRPGTVRLKRVTIPASSKANLRRELYKAGISDASLFPDLDGLGRDISYRYVCVCSGRPEEEAFGPPKGGSDPVDTEPIESAPRKASYSALGSRAAPCPRPLPSPTLPPKPVGI
jgi:hypothetical protein